MLNRKLNRRDLLKLMGLGVGSMVLVACGQKATPTDTAPEATEPAAATDAPAEEPTAVPEVVEPTALPVSDVVIVTTGWPIGLMPDEATQDSDPTAKVYAGVLQSWMDLHPGVTLEGSNVNIWSAQDIATAIAGGTAPMYYSGGAVGNWSAGGQMAAFAQGLAADVTALVDKYKIKEKVIAPAIQRWEFFKIAGHYYSIPQEYNVGNGIYYRIDLLKDAGLDLPKADWTWDDFRAMSKAVNKDNMHGTVSQQWGYNFLVQAFAGGADGAPFMEIPSPSTPWHYKYMHQAQPVVDALNFYRAMVWEDKSIFSDATFTDTEVTAIYNRGEAGFMFNNAGFYVLAGDVGIQPLETFLGKDRAETVGWINHPLGNNHGLSGTQSYVHNMALDPNASEEALDLGYNLYDYLTFGEGFTLNAVGLYESTQNLRQIFTAVPMINGVTEIPGIPGTIYDAWPKHYLDAIDAAANLPQLPDKGMYLPPETGTLPPASAYSDALTAIAFDETATDVVGLLTQASDQRNQQIETYASSITADEFKAGVTQYYADYGGILQTSAPEYYAEVWKPFYEAYIAPEIA